MDEAEQIIRALDGNERQLIEQDLQRLAEIRPDRVAYLENLQASVDRGKILADVEPAILSAESIYTPEFLGDQLQLILKALLETGERLAILRSRIQNFDSDFANLPNDQIYQLVREQIETETSEILSRLYKVSFEMSLIQAKARSNSIGLPEVELDEKLAFRIARCFRRDLMNARATLVDRWRRIEFFADELESRLDLVVDGGFLGVDNDPFRFSSSNGVLRAGFRFDAPIVRLAERNDYRQALIDYQQARRDYYLFRDEIHANLRQILRELDLSKILFELSRQNIQVAIEQVDLAQLSLEDPSATELGATTARDLTSAILSLQNALNRYVSVWVDYEALRRSLDFDLGTFQLGPDMSWIDPGKIDDSIAARAAAMLGINLEDECYCDVYSYPASEMDVGVGMDLESDSESMLDPDIDPGLILAPEPEYFEPPAQPGWESLEEAGAAGQN